jgi:DNA repair protein RadC
MKTQFPNAAARVAQHPSRRQENLLIEQAIEILEHRFFNGGPSFTHPADVRQYLRLKLAGKTQEIFAAVFLDTRHRLLAYEPLFFGTIDATTVHFRQVLLRALEHNCTAVIVAHNHPSGDLEPSHGDRMITKTLKELLSKIDVRLLDHFIIGKGEPYSFAEAGFI